MTIQHYFSGTPRPLQTQVMNELAESWDTHDVFVISAPVAFGKSRVAAALATWAGNSRIIVPNNLLVSQYTEEFGDALPTARAAASVTCESEPTQSCAQRAARVVRGRRCGYCRGCPAAASRAAYIAAPQSVANYYTYLANRAYLPTLIVDEAHNLLKMMTDDAATRLWYWQWGKGSEQCETVDDLVAFLEECVSRGHNEDKAAKLLRLIRRGTDRLVLEHTRERWRGNWCGLLKISQIDARGMPPTMYPPTKVRKIVLMSATINEHDVYDLGLDSRRVRYISTDSPIPAGNRPVVYLPTARMSHGMEEHTIPRLAARIQELMLVNRTRGIVHTTYDIAVRLREYLHTEPRLVWHTAGNKTAQYHRWRETEGAVLIASGMYEGIDLPGDTARWQVITKVPYPNLGEAAIAHKAAQRPEWYQWAAARDLIQASGRICRTPTDFGATYILDVNWATLYGRHRSLFPDWFRVSVR